VTARETAIGGLFVLEYEPHADGRGSFARVFDRAIFEANGLVVDYPQHAIAKNRLRGTLRGLHYQTAPFCESKVVHCVRGAVWDVVLDVRPASATFGRWQAFELSEAVPQQLYVGAGLAHGYVTLTSDAHLHYLISAPYSAEHSAGVHWRDAEAAIEWPLTDVIVSERDAALPALAGSRDPFAGDDRSADTGARG
jgi:dTDP-4-dehydrorhamnose 3,5-epimerase